MGKDQEKLPAGWIIIATDYSKLPLVAQRKTTWIKRKGHDTRSTSNDVSTTQWLVLHPPLLPQVHHR
jgi:hypothetical protein